ncbi:hypothetical protein FOPG_19693 [Fusarium oxysporum f. sp. conglutinans race 2 54008]|uniref:Uncharacterized protein n=1 Tax=Fusarium oxysporum f. sp. conglutinans race 2 54008 TaxID=1089457 RepID=X0GK71_FUSOX|nr:hypothetical protein FOPG_19693 [Fusarium oxysporum f. sp. conglutinans race 2 54008]
MTAMKELPTAALPCGRSNSTSQQTTHINHSPKVAPSDAVRSKRPVFFEDSPGGSFPPPVRITISKI